MAAVIGLTLLAIALVLMLVSGVWGLVLAFSEHPYWGFAYLFVPFAAFAFMIVKWSRRAVRRSFFLSFTGLSVWLSGFLVLFLTSNPNLQFLSSWSESSFASLSETDSPESALIPDPANHEPLSLEAERAIASQSPAELESKPSPSSSTPAPEAAATAAPRSAQTSQNPSDTTTPQGDNYHQTMMTGYDAFQKKDYESALAHFRHALNIRPGDTYATDAIRNTESLLQKMSSRN